MDNYWLVDKMLNVSGYVWVHTDGIIDIYGLTVKYLEKYEFWDVCLILCIVFLILILLLR